VLDEHAEDPLVARLRDVTGQPAWRPRDLADTRVAQPCVVVAGLLTARLAPTDRLTALVGHSLGEITALVHAGALDADDALDLVQRRAALGHEVHDDRPGAMVAVLKLDAGEVEWLRRRAVGETGGLLDLAVVNGPRQLVLSGDEPAVRRAADLAAEAGGVGRVLGIGGAYHSPLLLHAVASFEAAVAALARRDPAVPVVSSTLGRALTAADELPAALARALVLPVRWEAALRCLAGLGVRHVLDAGPGRTLTNLADHLEGVPPFSALRPPAARG